jgi:hypothetical protein
MFVDNLWGFIALFTTCVLVMFTMFHLVANVAVPMITKLLKTLSKKQGYNYRNGLLDQAVVLNSERNEVQSAMIAEFQKNSNNSNYKLTELYGGFSADMFNVLLHQAGYIVTTFTEWCEDKTCKTISKLVAIDGTTLFVSFGFHPAGYEDHKGRQKFKFEKEDSKLSVFVDAEKLFTYGNSMNIVHSSHLNEYDDSIAEVLRCFKDSKVEMISYKEPSMVNSRVGRISYGSFGAQINWEGRKINNFTDEMIDSEFAPIKLSYGGEQYNCHASDAFNFATVAMTEGTNIFVYGLPGLGKTIMAEQLLSRLQRFENAYCVWLGVDTITTMLQRSGGVQEIIEVLQNIGHRNDEHSKFYLFIDEAEKLLEDTNTGVHSPSATLMLELLDGAVRKSIGDVTTCLVFNADPTKLNNRLFRKGRGMLLELSLLDADRATKFMLSLRDTMKGKIFDAKQFDKLLTEEQRQTDGQIYAPVGFTTVADVVDCYRPAAMNDVLLTAIRAADKPKVYSKPEPKATAKVTTPVVMPAPQLKAVKVPSPNVVVATTPGPELPLSPKAATPQVQNYKKKHKNRNRR